MEISMASQPQPNATTRFCPHVTLLAIVTPLLWIALIYMLMVR